MRRPFYREDRGAWYVRTNGGRTQKRLHEDEEKAMQLWAEMLAVDNPQDAGAPVAAIAERFLAWAERNVAASTYDWYLYYLVRFCNEHGTRPTRTLKPYHVTQWLDQNATWGDSSRRAAVMVVKRCLNWAVREGYLEKNPLAAVEKPAAQRRRTVIDDEQHRAMMLAEDKSGTRRPGPFRAVMIALRHSGARPGTVASVSAADVSPTFDRWIMQQHKTRKKTGKPLTVYLSPCLQTLTRILAERRTTGPLFLNSRHEPWTRNAIRTRMRNLRKKLNLPPGTVAYAYRHTYATKALLNGTDVSTVAELLGHGDIRMIQDHYGHLDQAAGHLKQAAASVYTRRHAAG